jgi:hypothetical protein
VSVCVFVHPSTLSKRKKGKEEKLKDEFLIAAKTEAKDEK